MPFATGTVEVVNMKEMPEPDKFENTHYRSMKLGDVWYNLPPGKGTPATIPGKGDKRHTLSEGDEIEFIYDTFKKKDGSEGRQVKLNKVTLLKAGEGSPKPAAGGSQPKLTAYTGSVSGLAGIKVGHAITNAVQLAVARKGKAVTIDDVSIASEEILKLSKDLEERFEGIVGGKKETPAPAPKKSAPKPAPAVEESDDGEEYPEDDSPF